MAAALLAACCFEPTGGVVIGAVVFNERLATSWALAVQAAAAVTAAAGIVILDRSPLVRT